MLDREAEAQGRRMILTWRCLVMRRWGTLTFFLASEHKAFVHTAQHIDKPCVYLIIALFNMVISWLVLK